MNYFGWILLTGFSFGCSSAKEVKIDDISIEPKETRVIDADFNVFISVSHHTPYCGGAAPTEETLALQNQPQRNTSFILINLTTNEKTKIHTDSTGVIRFELPYGKYAIKETYKECTFEEFLIYNQPKANNYIESTQAPNCYEDWWKSYLGEFEVKEDTEVLSLKFQTREACFVGRNPCLYYNGPMPP